MLVAGTLGGTPADTHRSRAPLLLLLLGVTVGRAPRRHDARWGLRLGAARCGGRLDGHALAATAATALAALPALARQWL